MDTNGLRRVLGIDYGERRMGLAVSDPLGIIAKPFKTLDRQIISDYFSEILNIISQQDINLIIVGLPLTLKGKHSKQTIIVQNFIDKLKQKVIIPVLHIDERLSSVAAERSLKEQNVKTGYEKGRIDETAAAIILQEYLDSQT